MNATIEYIDQEGAIIASVYGSVGESIYLNESELRWIYESLRAHYSDCEKTGKTGREN